MKYPNLREYTYVYTINHIIIRVRNIKAKIKDIKPIKK